MMKIIYKYKVTLSERSLGFMLFIGRSFIFLNYLNYLISSYLL